MSPRSEVVYAGELTPAQEHAHEVALRPTFATIYMRLAMSMAGRSKSLVSKESGWS